MKISYDPAKNRINQQKHGIGLDETESVFFDGAALTTEDRDHDEQRFVTLGLDARGRLLVVAYVWRGEAEIRVFSARRAEPHERRLYETGT
ncbi:MAG: BrnT family toxin [Azoarcus sp.]|jgi:uncharacterized DUF497 family protein|nr:BrnT family toxin [Azoarcus sp.]